MRPEKDRSTGVFRVCDSTSEPSGGRNCEFGIIRWPQLGTGNIGLKRMGLDRVFVLFAKPYMAWFQVRAIIRYGNREFWADACRTCSSSCATRDCSLVVLMETGSARLGTIRWPRTNGTMSWPRRPTDGCNDMMMQLNRVVIAGYISKTPAVRYLPSGTSVANVRVGESVRY